MFEGAVEYVEAPGTEGYFGVLAHHASLVSGLAEGTLKVRDAGGQPVHVSDHVRDRSRGVRVPHCKNWAGGRTIAFHTPVHPRVSFDRWFDRGTA